MAVGDHGCGWAESSNSPWRRTIRPNVKAEQTLRHNFHTLYGVHSTDRSCRITHSSIIQITACSERITSICEDSGSCTLEGPVFRTFHKGS